MLINARSFAPSCRTVLALLGLGWIAGLHTAHADAVVTPRLMILNGAMHPVAAHDEVNAIVLGGNFSVPDNLEGVVAISASMDESVALNGNGRVVAWGNNGNEPSNVPPGLMGVVAVATSEFFTLALKNDGTVTGWGSPLYVYGLSAVPYGVTDVVAIAVGSVHSLVLTHGGTVIARGDNTQGQTSVPAHLTGVKAIAAGSYHSLALKSDGSVVEWGSMLKNNVLVPATVPDGLSGVKAIAAGGDQCLALKNDGTVVAWGGGVTYTPPLSSLHQVQAIATGGGNINLALNGDGTVVGWDAAGRVLNTVPAGLTGVTAIAAGFSHALALKNDGSVVAWGSDLYGQASPPASHGDLVAIAAGAYTALAIKRNGTVFSWGETRVPAGLSGVTAIAAGDLQNLALKGDGTVDDFSGGLSGMPPGLTGIIGITAGNSAAAALKSDGTVVAWGTPYDDPFLGPVGLRNVPAGLRNVTALAAGEADVLALRSNGTVTAWGWNLFDQTKVPAGLRDVIALATGGTLSMALKTDGTVIEWGTDDPKLTKAPKGLGDVVAIATFGPGSCLALKNDGTVVMWGNYPVSLSPPSLSGMNGVSAISFGRFPAVLVRPGGTFPARLLGKTLDQTLYLDTDSVSPLVNLAATITGPDADQFSVDAIASNGGCYADTPSPFTVHFSPTRFGPLNATLTIANASPATSVSMPLSGMGSLEAKAGATGNAFSYGPLTPDRLTGSMVQKLRFTNPSTAPLNGLRLVLSKVAAGVQVYSSSAGEYPGKLDVLYTNPIQPGETVTFSLVYRDPLRRTGAAINPVITAEPLASPVPAPGPVNGSFTQLLATSDTPEGPLLQWNTVRGGIYIVEYSDDQGTTWHSAVHRLGTAGTHLLWVDRGQPETQTKPVNKAARMYRVKKV